MKPVNINAWWGSLLVEELIRSGVDYFCLSPGSRSTPLTVAVAAHDQAKSIVHFDERGAAFHALGYARATGQPAVLICTSGTAAVNYFPAVVEASIENIPLIMLTADRPSELQGRGANQTIDQVRLYGDYPRWQGVLPCPSAEVDPSVLLNILDEAIGRSTSLPPGPVHVNCPFRKPLAPTPKDFPYDDLSKSIASWIDSSERFTPSVIAPAVIEESDVQSLSDLLCTDDGLLVIGGLSSPGERQAVLRLTETLGWPTLPDICSGLRMVDSPVMISYYDQLLLSENFSNKVRPLTVVHIGGRILSKRLQQLLEKSRPAQYVMINHDPARLDPGNLVTQKLVTGLGPLAAKLTSSMERKTNANQLTLWKEANAVVEKIINKDCSDNDAITEPSLARELSRLLSKDTGLFLASSMPIRDMDMFAACARQQLEVGANRGASGIDGTIASATGYAQGLQKKVTLLIGDLAFLHDLNSLALLNKTNHPVTVVVVNNNGGGIFEHLPIGEFGDLTEQYFVTPHALTFERAAAMFALEYIRVDTLSGFTTAYKSVTRKTHSSIIEVTIDRPTSLAVHRSIADHIRSALDVS